MAIYKNSYPFGSIVRNGLVLSLDATNLSSYPGSGNIWYDTSGNGNSGSFVSGAYNDMARGRSSIVFDGSSSYANFSSLANIHSTSNLTLESWVMLLTTGSGGGYRGIIGKGTTDTDEEYCLLVLPSTSSGRVYMDVGQSFGPYIDAPYPILLNTVYHIVGTHSRISNTSTLSIYVNGSLISNVTSGSTFGPNSNSYNTTIGSRFSTGGLSWPGRIYITNIYNRALTAAEVQQNFNALRNRFGI